MTTEDSLSGYSRRRSRAQANRKRRRLRAMAGRENSMNAVLYSGQSQSGRSTSQDYEVNFSLSDEQRTTYDDPHCCCAMWQPREKPIRRTLSVILIMLAIFKMVCAMIFASIHVVLTFSSEEAANDLQTPLPIYLSAAIVAVSGLCDMILSKLQPPYMILTGIFFSISTCVVSLAGLLSAATVSLPTFSSFVHFRYSADDQTCTAFTRWDMQPNGTFKGGVTFHDLLGCSLIESTLPPLTVALVAFYGVACFTSFVVCFVLSLLLCLPEKKNRLERLRRASASTYINYDLELDHICDDPPTRDTSLDTTRAAARKSISEPSTYLPGVAIPYYTLPYRIPVLHCQHTSRGIDRPATSQIPTISFSQMTNEVSSCGCKAPSVKTVASSRQAPHPSCMYGSRLSQNTELFLFLCSSRPRVTSATTNPRKSNHRPVIPIEFRCIDNTVQSTLFPRSEIESTSRPLDVAEASKRQGAEHLVTPKYVGCSGNCQNAAIGGNEIGSEIWRERHDGIRNSSDEGSTISSPPPYTELPPRDQHRPVTRGIFSDSGRNRRHRASPSHEETIL